MFFFASFCYSCSLFEKECLGISFLERSTCEQELRVPKSFDFNTVDLNVEKRVLSDNKCGVDRKVWACVSRIGGYKRLNFKRIVRNEQHGNDIRCILVICTEEDLLVKKDK